MATAPIFLHPEHFRALMRRQGETCVWYKALPCDCYNPESSDRARSCGDCDQGLRYVLQTLDAAIRVRIGETTRMLATNEMGLIPVGTTTITTMPDELPITKGDKITLDRRVATHKAVYKRGSGATDTLKRAPAIAIQSVAQGTTIYVPGTDYERVGDTIRWLTDTPPAAGSNYAVVHTYHPTYWFLDEFRQEAPPSQLTDTGGNPLLLPLWGALTLKHPFTPNN